MLAHALLVSLALAALDPQTLIDRLPEGARADAAAAMDLAGRKDPGAIPILKGLKEAYPEEPRVFLLAALATEGNAKGTPLEDVGEALRLGLPAEERGVALTLRALLRWNLGQNALAREDVEEVLAQAPADPSALEVALRIALTQKRREEARGLAARLGAAQPGNPLPHLLLAALALEEEDFERARAELKQARALGAQGESIDRVQAAVDEKLRGDLWIEVPLWAAGGLLLALALILGLGLAISVLQRRRPAARGLLDTVHAGVLWLAVVAFYLSFPLVVGFAGLAAYAAVRLAFEGVAAAGFISLRMIVVLGLLVVGALLGLVGVITGFLAKPARPKLRPLGPSEAPELFQALAEVAQVAASRPVSRVEICLAPDVSVHEAGSTLGVLLGRGERVLTLGLAALRGLSVSQLKAVLAHELGHFAHGETRVAPVIAGVTLRLASICANYRSLGTMGKANPVYWYLAGYLGIFQRLSAGLSRRHELQADQVAARAYGGASFAAALRAVDENGLLFGRYFLVVALELRRSGRRFGDAIAALGAIAGGLPDEVRARLEQQRSAQAPASGLDTHPPTAERVKATEGLAAARPAEDAPWTSLLRQHGELCRELTRECMAELDAQLEAHDELPATSVDLAPEAEGRLAAALVVHVEALEALEEALKKEEGDAKVSERIAESIRGLAAAVGENDRFLLEPLKRLADAQARLGLLAQAEASVDRALEIATAVPETRGAALELQSMKRSLRASQGLFTPELEAPPAAAPAAVAAAALSQAAIESGEAGQAPQKTRCGGCGSAFELQDALRRGTCPWCGAAWKDPEAASAEGGVVTAAE